MLYYAALESYASRYTMQWAAPKTGWLERRWIEAGIEYERIAPKEWNRQREIKAGCVLDAVGRSQYCFVQTDMLLNLAEQGKITDNDTLYFDDFFHPGFEALPYAFSLLGIKPKMYAFLHAQSVDRFDFTAKYMLPWIRPFERGIASVLDGIFVCCPSLKECVVNGGDDKSGMQYGGLCGPEKVFVTGHPFASDEVLERMPRWYTEYLRGIPPMNFHDIGKYDHSKRKNQVVWSSRWDEEKQPDFFLKVAELVIKKQPYAKFVICTSAPKLRSNNPALLTLLQDYITKYPINFELKEGLTKEAYYGILCESKIQMNTALQDWVAITLLESSVAGAYPIYPRFRSFPETLRDAKGFMYEPWDAKEAADMVLLILNQNHLWSVEAIKKRSWIHARFDTSWKRQAQIMGLLEGTPDNPYAGYGAH